jgi:hypothetical protein
MPGRHHFLPHAQGRLTTSQGCVKSATFVCALVLSRRPWLHRSRIVHDRRLCCTHAAVATYGFVQNTQSSRQTTVPQSLRNRIVLMRRPRAEQTKKTPSSARTVRKEQALPADWANASVSEPQRPLETARPSHVRDETARPRLLNFEPTHAAPLSVVDG